MTTSPAKAHLLAMERADEGIFDFDKGDDEALGGGGGDDSDDEGGKYAAKWRRLRYDESMIKVPNRATFESGIAGRLLCSAKLFEVSKNDYKEEQRQAKMMQSEMDAQMEAEEAAQL